MYHAAKVQLCSVRPVDLAAQAWGAFAGRSNRRQRCRREAAGPGGHDLCCTACYFYESWGTGCLRRWGQWLVLPLPATPGRIFISYRREETGYPAGWLYDRLAARFGGDQVFKDVDSIQLGDDFVEVITQAVGSCDVLLALIGDRWSTITDGSGRHRLDDPDDFVRLEIEAALTRGVRVIPILVDGARMPAAAELPESLVTLVRRQSLELSPTSFEFDTNRLLKVLDSTLAEVRTTRPHPVPRRAPAGTASDPSPGN